MKQFWIIGAGMGTPGQLTGEAREALCAADAAFSTDRLAAQLSALRPVTACPYSALAERAIEAPGQSAALLVSGDTGFFSAASSLRTALAAHGTVAVLPGLSSLQTLCARLGTSYEHVMPVSLHGRDGSLVGPVSYHARIFALTGGTRSAGALCAELAEWGLGGVSVTWGENLGSPEEQVLCSTAEALAGRESVGLVVLLVENPQAADCRRPLRDSDFVRGQVPMTKQEVRWAAVSLLDVRPHEVVWDVGAGTGSVALALGRCADRGQVYAIEHKPEALDLIEENRRALGGFNVRPVAGRAPEALADLPAPDAVFVGGSGGELREILALAKARNPAVRVCVSAIALETVALAHESLQALGFSSVEVCQISAARGRRVGGYTMMTANNPVYLLTGGGQA